MENRNLEQTNAMAANKGALTGIGRKTIMTRKPIFSAIQDKKFRKAVANNTFGKGRQSLDGMYN